MLALSLTNKEKIILEDENGKIIAIIRANECHEHSPTIAKLTFEADKKKVIIYREKL